MRLPVEDVFNVAGFRYLAETYDYLGKALYWRGLKHWEPVAVERFVHYARGSRVLFDIGAHTGLYSLVAAAVNPSIQVIAFEPEPRNFERLAHNIALNKWDGRVHLRQQAVAAIGGTALFSLAHENAGMTAHIDAVGGTFEVPVTTVDEQPLRPDLVKIDVEGAELDVLHGMRRTLAEDRPIIFIELHRSIVAEGTATLSRAGYSVEPIHETRMKSRNYLAVPCGRAETSN